MRSQIPLSLLELASVRQGDSIHSTFNHARHYAQAADDLGFSRFWLAEHHNMEGIASSATSVLIGHIAANTQRIRVGSGGIMLPNHPPLVIAEQFGTLASLYPNRIDLGLGRAPGTDMATARALRRDLNAADDFANEIAVLEQLLQPAQPGQRLMAYPGAGTQVPLWILGSSLYSAHLAAARGLPYAFAGHFAPKYMREAARIYRTNFCPSQQLAKPHFILSLPVLIAESEARAAELLTTPYQRILALFRGDPLYLKPPVASMDGLWAPQEQAAVKEFLALACVGTKAQVEGQLNRLAAEVGVDEFMFVVDVFDTNIRLAILQQLAELDIQSA